MELAHANRVETMGQLSASIAHEVNQPIAAAAANARAALRWLRKRPPNIEEALLALDRIANDTERAGGVMRRIHALVKKAPHQKELLDINDAIREVIMVTQGEVTKNRVSLAMDLGERLPFIEGDRVQIQQVMLNLIMNAVSDELC
jgi:C4-dicarboxylate-specific signal transduction histidine kinase